MVNDYVAIIVTNNARTMEFGRKKILINNDDNKIEIGRHEKTRRVIN